MKLYHIDKAREYRRIILDVYEVCPRLFRYAILQTMACIREEGILIAMYSKDLHYVELQFFHRLKNSRSFRCATPYQSGLLLSILGRLEEAYLYDTGQAFRFETAEEKQARRKANLEFIQHQTEWSLKHPCLSNLLFLFTSKPVLFLMIFSIIAMTFYIFISRYPALLFWY